MNQGFAPLYSYVANLDLIGQLIEQEQAVNGGLSDLAFLAEYDLDDLPGRGRILVYRQSAGSAGASVNAGLDNMQGRLWFVENDTWRVENLGGRHYPSLLRFDALIATIPDYRPALRVALNKPLLDLRVWDLPLLPQYPQLSPATLRQQLLLAA